MPLHAQIPNLNQRTNFFISQDSYNLIWISSLNGVYLYNGKEVRIFNSLNSNLRGENIQSYFYEDCNKNIWFSSLNALHIYDREADSLRYFELREQSDNLITSGYQVFGNYENTIFIYSNSTLFLFDINTETVYNSWFLPNWNIESLKIAPANFGVTLFISTGHKLLKVEIPNLLNKSISVSMILSNVTIRGLSLTNNYDLLFNDYRNKCLLRYSNQNQMIDTIVQSKNIINSFASYDNQLVYEDGLDLRHLDISSKSVLGQYPLEKDVIILPTFIAKDLIGYGIDGLGVRTITPSKKKIELLPLKPRGQPANPRNILQDVEGNLWFCSRFQGFCKFDKSGVLIKQYGGSQSHFGFDMILNDQGYPLAIGNNSVFEYDSQLDKFNQKDFNFSNNLFLAFLEKLKNGRILVGDVQLSNSLYELISTVKGPELKPLKFDQRQKHHYQYIYAVNDTTILVGTDLKMLTQFTLKEDSLIIEKKFDLEAEVKSIVQVKDSLYYLSTNTGLFKGNIHEGFSPIIDSPGTLQQLIYRITPHHNFLFLSTNNGLLRYHTTDNSVYQFSIADGIQGSEYNTNSSLVDDEGYFYFGGTQGINKFHPDSVIFSQKEPKIFVSNILINGRDFDFGSNVSHLSKFENTYENNTMTFYFHGIDHADPSGVNLKYKLEGNDTEWQFLDHNNAVVRYTDLKAGAYSFNMLASNSDGYWMKKPRTIDFVIKPPYWQTWWFRLLVVGSIVGLLYYIVKNHYDRKLEKKNAQIREKELIIEAQIALENERTRIATDMHDDLGSGLTMIKYLSDKAAGLVENEETIGLIQKITTYSNTLVQNMSEIIWAMNTRFDSSSDLIAYMRRYVAEFLEEHNTPLKFLDQSLDDHFAINGIKRRSIFLAIKESLHNSIKHSKASAIEFTIFKDERSLRIDLHEIGGIGFNFENSVNNGNGLYNIKKRMDEVGSVSFDHTDEGFLISFRITI